MLFTYHLYTDGACRNNPGPGGWAFLLREPSGKTTVDSGYDPRTTNNRMELSAALFGLRRTPTGSEVTLHADSTYLLNGLGKWLKNWKKAQYMRNGEPIPNSDLWRELDAEIGKRKMTYVHVRGHSGDTYNEQCDLLARKAIESAGKTEAEGSNMSPEAEDMLRFVFDRGYDKSKTVAVVKEVLRFLTENSKAGGKR